MIAHLWWLYAILAAAAALTIAAIVLLVGSETEERPGYIDLTGAVQRPRGRARAHPPTLAFDDQELHLELAREYGGRVVRVPLIGDGVGLHGEPLLNRVPDGADPLPPLTPDDPRYCAGLEVVELTETELAHRVATQQVPRGADAA